MYWEIWDLNSKTVVDTFDTEDEALQGVRALLAVNRPDLVDDLALGAMYDEDDTSAGQLPPALTGVGLRDRLAETAPVHAGDVAPRAAHEKIRRWMAEEGWHVRNVDDLNASFNVMVTLPGGATVNICQYRHHRGHITISQHWKYPAELQSALHRLPEDQVRDIAWNIYRDSSIMGVEFSGLETPATELTLQTSIYFDGLTKDTFIQRVLLTLRALGIAVRTYLRALEAQSGPDSHGRSPEQRVFTREELREIVQVLPRADAPVTIAG